MNVHTTDRLSLAMGVSTVIGGAIITAHQAGLVEGTELRSAHWIGLGATRVVPRFHLASTSSSCRIGR